MQKILLMSLFISFNTFAGEQAYSLSSKASCQSLLQRKISLSKVNVHKNRLQNELKKVQNCSITNAQEDLITLCTQSDLDADFANQPTLTTECSSKFTKHNGQDYDLITCQTTAKATCLTF